MIDIDLVEGWKGIALSSPLFYGSHLPLNLLTCDTLDLKGGDAIR